MKLQYLSASFVLIKKAQSINRFSNGKLQSLPKLKEFADDNYRFDENGRTLSKSVENTVGKGEIARYEQFLLFPQCFQKTRATRALFGNG